MGPLYGVIAHPAGAAHDEYRLALDLAIGKDGAVCRHRRNAEARPDVETDRFRQARGVVAADRDVLRGRAEAAFVLCLEYPDPFALAAFVDALADRFDDACAVTVGNHESVVEQVREGACPFLDV